jgi:hypothetical protein
MNTHDFSSPEAWTDSIFRRASHFVVHRFGPAGRASMQVASFQEARRAAEQAQRAGCRVLLYAVSPEGRSALLPQSDWDRCAAMSPRQAAE